jgi:hypothetical protein
MQASKDSRQKPSIRRNSTCEEEMASFKNSIIIALGYSVPNPFSVEAIARLGRKRIQFRGPLIFGGIRELVVAAPQYRAAANTAMGWKNANLGSVNQ